MESKKTTPANLFLYVGLTKEQYGEIKSHMVSRNLQTLRLTSILCFVIAVVFLIVNLITKSGMYFPYAFLAAAGLLILGLQQIPSKSRAFSLFLCYLMMISVFTYAFILSSQKSNIAIPATSIIVFLALFPLTIDDRPVRMCSVVLLFTALYLIYSKVNKTPQAFSLDLTNAITFSLIGMALYIVICRRNVHEIYESRHVDRLQKDVISSLATVIEERDESTGKHIARTEVYIKKLASEMKNLREYHTVGASYFDDVYRAAPLHDIGKIKVPDNILNKPGKLTPEEYEIIKKHAGYGAEIIEKTMDSIEQSDYFNIARNIALYHHERYDGKGYPTGLKGEEIPLEARMMALSDVYDALISERVYKKAYSKEEAVRIIKEGRGTQFDPVLTDLFLKALE